MSPILTLKDVSQHRKKDDIWLAIHGKVYDVTGFIDEHPGGEEVLADSAGTDASGGFDDVEHSDEAMNIIKTLQIGVLEEEVISYPIQVKPQVANAVALTY
ncbi:cytochrome b5 [Penicillium nucicola]|uniref:cytochrome b5 n=1 Tax=Penicillium nucicola TaxID=1850975 RepID=UPI002544D719|nr:cytochrome b5 [Penicillium nucicola]KAJ5771259.1 cytochrome b5 [Penicillium nucicola]